MPRSPQNTVSSAKPLGAGPRASQIRLVSGLYLFLFVATHYLNHALGLISFEVMEAGRDVFLLFWRFPPVEILLAAALVAHAGLALLKAARSNSFRMTAWEWLQLLLGLSLPFLLAEHILGTRGLSLVDGLEDTYAWTVLALWPDKAYMQTVAIFAVWAHGCIGIHLWLRLRPWYGAVSPWLLGVAVLWPVLALLGFADAGQAVLRFAAEPGWVADMLFDIGFLGPEQGDWVAEMSQRSAISVSVIIGIAAAWRTYCWQRARRLQAIAISYPGGEIVRVAKGVSVLEASKLSGIPHANVCGGRGRCSTCRVRISAGLEDLPLADSAEQAVLDRVNAPASVRLACQLRPAAAVTVAPLLPPTANTSDARNRSANESGSEREIAIMFVDIRAFTKLSEDKLPFDIVFLLNQYFRSMGSAIEENMGQLDKFIGDGIMALYGIESGPAAGCRQALAATVKMSEVLHELNQALASDLEEPLRIGIGVHVGSVIVGEMGFGSTMSVTAIGDAVNVASRLEPMTKEFKSEAIISEEVMLRAGIRAEGLKRAEVSVRGREQPLDVVVLMNGQEDLKHYLEMAEAAE